MSYFSKYEKAISDHLNASQFTNLTGIDFDSESGLNQWLEITHLVSKSQGTLYFIGNGASAMMSSHLALDFTKSGGVKSLAFNDPAFLTAISNDHSYDSV